MTSLPQLNPNAAGQGSPEARFNRATLGVYELGSTFKPFTVAMAMDSGIIKSFGKMYPCPDELHVFSRTINDTHPFNRACSVAEIMKESSNIGTAQIAAQIGGNAPARVPRQDGLPRGGARSSLRERGRPLLPGNNWGPLETMTVGYGHGIAVTPLHLASGYATLFNGGIYRPPTLFKIGKGHAAGKGHRVFSEQTSYKMRSLLRLVVTDGTGKKADAPGYRVGGKTGSAEKYHNRSLAGDDASRAFSRWTSRAMSMVVMLDEPKGTAETFGFRTAGWNVAPACRQDRQPDRADAWRPSRQEPRT